jgi:anthranilate phosphoribosyltransferase
LPRSRTAIIGINHGDHFERLTLSARNYGFSSEDPAIADASEMATKILSALQAEPSEYLNSVLWNCGFYLWLYGLHDEINDAITHAKEIINSGRALEKLKDLRA